MKGLATVKKLFVPIIISVTLLLSSCGLSGGSGEKSFNARIVSIQQNYVTVTPLEGSDELRSSDLFVIDAQSLDGLSVNEGDILLITYRGGILETYPAKLTEIVSVVKSSVESE